MTRWHFFVDYIEKAIKEKLSVLNNGTISDNL